MLQQISVLLLSLLDLFSYDIQKWGIKLVDKRIGNFFDGKHIYLDC